VGRFDAILYLTRVIEMGDEFQMWRVDLMNQTCTRLGDEE